MSNPIRQRRMQANYLKVPNETKPQLLGVGAKTLDENPAAQTKSRRYVCDKSATKSVSGYDWSTAFDVDQIRSQKAIDYIHEKMGESATEEPTSTPEEIPMETAEPVRPQEDSGGSPVAWIIGIILLLAAGGGGYAWYVGQQRKRKAAQAAARKRASQQKAQQAARARNAGSAPESGRNGKAPAQPAQRQPGVSSNGTVSRQAVSAQSASRVRTGAYAERNGGASVRPVGPEETEPVQVRKPYGASMDNPYARYTSDGEEDQAYTASLKPAENGTGGTSARRRSRSERYSHTDDES